MTTVRSRWVVPSVLTAGIFGFLFAIMPIGAPPDAGVVMVWILSAGGFLGLYVAVRASLMRVVVTPSDLVVHGLWRTTRIPFGRVMPVCIDYKLIAYVWAPAVETVAGEAPLVLNLLADYGFSEEHASRRIERICDRLQAAMDANLRA